jgi:SulP family sulfate permease
MARQRSSIPIPRICTGLLAAWRDGYRLADLRKDVLAGLTVGTVAVPLSMALAIATGVAPQHGLYTAIVAGAVIALTGGARFNVSGPTAAFIVILLPIVQQYGLGGLLIATLMAGLILVAMGAARLGRLIEFVPYPVVLGFTTGIAVVIAALQIPDFLGLDLPGRGEHFLDNLSRIAIALPSINPFELGVGLLALAVMLLWPRLGLPVPAPLVGLLVGAVAAYALNQLFGSDGAPVVQTISSRFTWEAHGQTGAGIPPIAPAFTLPWLLPGPNGQALTINLDLFRALLGPAFAIAILGAIESLLCAVVSDGLTKTKHDPNAELIGQGLGNLIAPFFGGITATAALARTATNIRSGARSPLAAATHAAVLLLAVLVLAKPLGLIPMSALAALLFIVAWNMSEARHFVRSLRCAPREDVAILLICFGLTVIFDMVLAVGVGMGLAGALFIRRMALVTNAERVDPAQHRRTAALGPASAIYEITGPLFFGVADKALTSLHEADPNVKTVLIDMSQVPSIDGTAIVALQSLIDNMQREDVGLILVGLRAPLIVTLHRAGVKKEKGRLTYCKDMECAIAVARRWNDA